MELAASSPLRDAFASGRRNGVVRMRSGLDNEMKIVAYRQVGNYPVFVSSGYPVTTIWAGWYRRIGVLMLFGYFLKLERYVGFDPMQWRPQLHQWKRILNVGLPAGGEFAMIFIIMAVVYYVLRDFGAAAQAGFGIGTRVLGLIQMPALAVALAAGPIAGQNFGAGNAARVRETFVKAALIGTAVMIAFMMLARFAPGLLLGGFSNDRETMAVAAQFLHFVSFNMVAQGLVFTCSGMFQGLGNTRPVLLSSASRIVSFTMVRVGCQHDRAKEEAPPSHSTPRRRVPGLSAAQTGALTSSYCIIVEDANVSCARRPSGVSTTNNVLVAVAGLR